MNKNECNVPCGYWTRTSKQSLLRPSETYRKLLRRVSLDNKLPCDWKTRYIRVRIHNANVDQDLFDRSEIVCFLECFVIPNGLL